MGFRITPDRLAVTVVGGAVAIERAYAEERKHVPLKKKYRCSRGRAPQWGVGGDHTGKKRIKGVGRRQDPFEPTMRRVMVITPTGKRTFVWEAI